MPIGFTTDVLQPALYSIVAVTIPVVAGFCIDAIRKWAHRQQAEWIRMVMVEAMDAADRAVGMVEQTYARHQRDSRGRLDGKAAEWALEKALVAAMQQLGKEGQTALARVTGNEFEAESTMTTMIESALNRRKIHPYEDTEE